MLPGHEALSTNKGRDTHLRIQTTTKKTIAGHFYRVLQRRCLHFLVCEAQNQNGNVFVADNFTQYRAHFYRDGKVRGQNAQRREAKFNLFPTEAGKNADASM